MKRRIQPADTKFEHEAANFDFTELKGKSRRYLQAVVSYEYARESRVLRERVRLWSDKKASIEALWKAVGCQGFVIWKAEGISNNIESGVFLNVARMDSGRAVIQEIGNDMSGRFGAVSQRRCRLSEEHAFLKARLRDMIHVGGEGSVYLTDVAEDLLADRPWERIDSAIQNRALQLAKLSAYSERPYLFRTTRSAHEVQLATESEVARIGLWKQFTDRQRISEDGYEVIALRLQWKDSTPAMLAEQFQRWVELFWPTEFRPSGKRDGCKSVTQWKYLDDLSIMRALSVFNWKQVDQLRREVGLWKRSNTQSDNKEAVRRDLLAAQKRAIERFRALFAFEAKGLPLHSRATNDRRTD